MSLNESSKKIMEMIKNKPTKKKKKNQTTNLLNKWSNNLEQPRCDDFISVSKIAGFF